MAKRWESRSRISSTPYAKSHWQRARPKAQLVGKLRRLAHKSSHDRSRANLRHDVRRHKELMLVELGEWWERSSGGDQKLNKQEYKHFYQRLAYTVRGDELSGAGLVEAMETDWRNDSKGKGLIEQDDFFDSIFEMAVTWAMPADSVTDLGSGRCFAGQANHQRIN